MLKLKLYFSLEEEEEESILVNLSVFRGQNFISKVERERERKEMIIYKLSQNLLSRNMILSALYNLKEKVREKCVWNKKKLK